MRETYRLTSETRAVLTDNVTAIAAEMDVNTSYLYQILSSVESDPFAKFHRIYAASVRAGAHVHHWDVELQTIRERYTDTTPAIEAPAKLTADISREFAEFIEAELEGKSFERQISELMDVINAATKKKNDLIAAKNKAAFGNGHISYDTRNEIKARLGKK